MNILVKTEVESKFFYKELLVPLKTYGYNLLILGGAIRDIVRGSANEIRDWDIAVGPNFTSDPKVLKILEEFEAKKNHFGGYKFSIDEDEIDLWPYENTWAFKQMKKTPNFSPEALMKTVFLSINTISYWVNTEEVHEIAFSKSLEKGMLIINNEENPLKAYNIIRTYKLCEKLNLKLDQKGKVLLKSWVTKQELKKMFRIESKEYIDKILYWLDAL